MEREIPVAYPLNKLGWASDLLISGVVVFFFLCHRRGGKAEVAMASDLTGSAALGVEADTLEFSWSASSADLPRRRPAVLLLTLMAVRRALRALVLALCWRHLCFSLRAGVSKGRVFCSSVAALNACLSPSGIVRGGGAGGRGVELAFIAGGEGPDGVPYILFRVLLVKVEDCNGISFYFEILFVNCKPTALE